MKQYSSRSGYTLTEVIIVVGILGVMVSMGSLLLIQIENFWLSASAHTTVQRDARASLDIINRMLRQAVSSSVVIDNPPCPGNCQGDYSRISFKMIDGRSVQFYQNGNQLVQVVSNDTSIISRNLSYLVFSFADTSDPTLINVALAMSQNVQLGRKQALAMSIQPVRIMN